MSTRAKLNIHPRQFVLPASIFCSGVVLGFKTCGKLIDFLYATANLALWLTVALLLFWFVRCTISAVMVAALDWPRQRQINIQETGKSCFWTAR